MEGRALARIAALVLAPIFTAPLVDAAEAQSVDAKEAKKTRAAKKKEPALSREAAEQKYQLGQELEKKGDAKGAYAAYLAAGESGHGLAQKRLGEILERGNRAVKRDYDSALRWYEKARAQGIEIPKPIVQQIAPR